MGRALTDEESRALAVWHRERLCHVRPWLCVNSIEDYARCLGIELDANNLIDLFHYIQQEQPCADVFSPPSS